MIARSFFFMVMTFLEIAESHAQTLPAIGQWREHLPYGSAIAIENSGKGIFTATPYSIFHNGSQGEISRYSKINGLAETGISAISYQPSTSTLVIAYSNSNIDLLQPGKVINIPDIKLKNISGDKKIYSIYIKDDLAYLSTGFGIVLINLSKAETKDSYFIGAGGQQISVYALTTDSAWIYAATMEGLKRAPISTDLRNPANWQNLSGINGLPSGPAAFTNLFSSSLLVQIGEKIYRRQGAIFTEWYNSPNHINSIRKVNGDKLLVCEQVNSSQGRVVQLLANGSIEKIYQQPQVQKPESAILDGTMLYVADRFSGLLRISGSSLERIIPNSPFEKASGEITFQAGKIFARGRSGQ